MTSSTHSRHLSVEGLIRPVTLRFSLEAGEIVYLFTQQVGGPLEAIERRMGLDPSVDQLFSSNIGSIPVCSTVLVRGQRNLLVDPGNHHIGFYGQLGLALNRVGLDVAEVDDVVCTHSHHDHMASLSFLPNARLIWGAGEREFAHALYGRETVQAWIGAKRPVIEVPLGGEMCPEDGVRIVSTPGHTPGHVSVVVEEGAWESSAERVVVAGDAIMTRAEFEEGNSTQWYDDAQRAEVEASIRRLKGYEPTVIIPGHDRPFRTG